jgi:hypothetical protein
MRLRQFTVGLLLLWPAANVVAADSVDESRAQSVGIRKIASRHLVLYTDLPSGAEVDRLPAIFDQAVPQWADYFEIKQEKAASWQAQACLIGERRRFDALGLMPPAGNDQFVNGISMGARLWLYDQPTAYYRRHLLLHEGTHAFMATLLGGCGPGWYMEGTAELLATHRLDEPAGKLTLGIMPRSREEVPMLGRIKLIRDAVAADRVIDFPAAMRIDNRKQLDNESYAWTWAAAKWLDTHPRYRDRFRNLKQHVLDANFNKLTERAYEDDWPELLAEWHAFIAMLDYGYDFQRSTIDFQHGRPLGTTGERVTIAADRGWQSAGVLLEEGKTYELTASGRFQIASEQIQGALQPWPCEPGGITLEYHDGRPLGMLLGAVANVRGNAAADFAKPIALGLRCELKPAHAGTLYLRVNDSAARLADNRGSLDVTIAEVIKTIDRDQ